MADSLLHKARTLLGLGAHEQAPEDGESRMQISAIAAKIGLPEERIAQMAQMIRMNGLADAQMGSMMQMATSKGITPDEVNTFDEVSCVRGSYGMLYLTEFMDELMKIE